MSDRADVLVVGAGAAGAVVARHLAERGFSVVCLEQGDWVDRSAFPGSKPEWELLAGGPWNPNPVVRGRMEDYPCETGESDVNPLMFAGVGGATLVYSAHWCRQAPSDFRVCSLDGVADDWPLSYDDLLPYYERLDVEMGISGLGGDPAYPPGAPPPLPPLSIGRIGVRAAEGMNRLGWHWWPGPNAIASRPYRNLARCTRRGTCSTGCPDGAKATMDLTHWPAAIRHGARLITGARVRELPVDERGRVVGAVWIDRDGCEHLQRADVTVLAANGVGPPRLLLLSASARFPDGLVNSSGLVGRRLMMHPFAAVVGVYEDELESWLGPAGQSIQTMQFYESEPDRGFVRGAKWQVMPTGGPLGWRSVFEGGAVEEAYGQAFHESVRATLGRSFEWGVIAEDLPDEGNRVVLDGALADSDGIPAPRILYRTSDNTRSLLDFHLERAREAHEAAGAVRTIVTPLMRDCGWHLMGTARMGDDPATSVVDGFGRAHDVPNLLVVDGSVSPTSSGVNPTATIAAVALRCAERLADDASRQEVPS